MYEAHFGVPMSGAVLNALNYRLDAAAIAFILEHAEAKVLLTDTEFSPTIEKALAIARAPHPGDRPRRPFGPGGKRLGDIEYEEFLAGGDPAPPWTPPGDEWEAISLNYTSGTTGNPKGVVYHHRGAYLNAHRQRAVAGACPSIPSTCGRCRCSTATAGASRGRSRRWRGRASACGESRPRRSTTRSRAHRVTHLCGAPIVMQMLLAGDDRQRASFDHQVNMLTAAAPPPAPVLEAMAEAGFQVTHVYGLTETYGPAVVCEWHDEWNALPIERAGRAQGAPGRAATRCRKA